MDNTTIYLARNYLARNHNQAHRVIVKQLSAGAPT